MCLKMARSRGPKSSKLVGEMWVFSRISQKPNRSEGLNSTQQQLQQRNRDRNQHENTKRQHKQHPSIVMPLSKVQKDALVSYGANYAEGLTSAEATERRRNIRYGGLNAVKKPINCPTWACILLPCIKHIPSMKLFKQIEPDDAEVLRNGRWVRYDAPSLVRGDIIRLEDGDVVPADVCVLSLGLESVDIDGEAVPSGSAIELVVDVKDITGEAKPRTSNLRKDGTATPTQIFYGSHVNQGSCIAVVTAIGPNTMLSSLIQDGRWPPKGEISLELQSEQVPENETDEEVGVALIERSS